MLHYLEPLSGQETIVRVVDMWNCGGISEEESRIEGKIIWPGGEDWWSRQCSQSYLQNQAKFYCKSLWKLGYASHKRGASGVLVEKTWVNKDKMTLNRMHGKESNYISVFIFVELV